MVLASVATLEQLLVSAASGDPQSVVALHNRLGGLVQLNIHRVLGDASRSERATQQIISDLGRDAAEFDPHRSSAQTWLLPPAHHAMDELDEDHTAAGSC